MEPLLPQLLVPDQCHLFSAPVAKMWTMATFQTAANLLSRQQKAAVSNPIISIIMIASNKKKETEVDEKQVLSNLQILSLTEKHLIVKTLIRSRIAGFGEMQTLTFQSPIQKRMFVAFLLLTVTPSFKNHVLLSLPLWAKDQIFFFYWSIIVFQCCVSSYCTTAICIRTSAPS